MATLSLENWFSGGTRKNLGARTTPSSRADENLDDPIFTPEKEPQRELPPELARVAMFRGQVKNLLPELSERVTIGRSRETFM